MKTCLMEGCAKPAATAGLCWAHYKRKQTHGDVNRGGSIRTLGQTRAFLVYACAYTGDECLLWPFARNNKGYAHLALDGHHGLAHRYVCEKVRGPAPVGKPFALHTCAAGHLGCIAPRHLKWGSHADNMVDMVSDGHSMKGERATAAKLTEADIRAIRSATGTQREIAARFGIDQVNVSRILRRKTWAHVP